MKKELVLSLVVIFMLSASISALADPFLDARKQRLEFGYSLVIENITIGDVPQGQPSSLKLMLKNNGDFLLKDIRIDVQLPSQISFVDDVSKRKISLMEPKEIKELIFNIIASPSLAEGVYDGSITTYYLNHMGTEKTENQTFSIIIKNVPKLFAKIDGSTIYQGKPLGEVTVTFVNNGVADIKFLTVELKESPDYEIIDSKEKYIGDLDSDDFESVDFNLKLTTENPEINLPISVSYKDSLNKDFVDEFNLKFVVRDPKELGIKTNGKSTIIIAVIIVVVIAFFIYRRYRKRKSSHMTKDGLLIPNLALKDIKKKR